MEKVNEQNIISLLFVLCSVYLINYWLSVDKRFGRIFKSSLYLFVLLFIAFVGSYYDGINVDYSFTVLFSLIGFYSGVIPLLVNVFIGVSVFTLFFPNNARLGVFIGFVSASILGIIFYQLSSKKILNKHPWLLLLFAIFVQILSFFSTSNYLLLDNTSWFNVILFNSISALTLYVFTLVEFHKWNSIPDSRFRQVEENYNFLLERVSGAVLKVDYLGRITYANKYLLSLLNVALHEIKGNLAVGLIFDKECDANRRIGSIVDYNENKCQGRFDSEIINKDGKSIWLSWDCKIADDNEHLLEILFTGVDITEWKNTAILKTSLERRLEQLHQGMLDSYARVNKEGRIVEFNVAFLNLVGYSDKEISFLTYSDLTPEKWRIIEKDIIDKQVLTRGYSDLYEKEYTRKDGTFIPVELRTYIVANLDGDFDGFWALIRDVSYRKDIESKLRLSETLYKSIVEKSPMPIIFIEVKPDDNIYIKNYNSSAQKAFGFGEGVVSDAKFTETIPLLSEDKLLSKLLSTALEGEDFRIDLFSIIKDNVQFYFEIRAFQVEPRMAVVILTDISQLMKEREQLELSEQKFRTVITENPMVFFMLDKNGIFTLSEGLGLAKLGLKPGQVVGLSVFDVYRDFPEIIESSKKSLNGLSVKLDLKVGDIYFNTVFTPVFDENNKVKNVLGVAYDITSRINAEMEVEQKSDELERYFNNSLDLLCIADLQGYLRKVNPEWTNLLGYSADELEGKRFFDFIHPDDIESTNFAIKELSDRGRVLNFTNRYITKQGDYRWIEWRSFLDSNLVYAVARDITERRFAEEQIIENDRKLKEQNEEYIALNEELSESNQRIREINEKLIEATEKAQESDRLKSSFLANMSHEIRTPMNGIVGFCQLLKQTNNVDEQVTKYCDIIATSSNQLLAIINDIIDISKIEAGQVSLSHEPVSIMDVVERTTAIFSALANQKNVALRINSEIDSRLVILSDQTKIAQILSNLVNNAIKFTKQGFVEVGVNENSKHLKIWVRDTGIGIAKENQDLIFDRFRQIEEANPNSMKGTGLGLSISKSLVEMLGGEIWVDSDIGKGAKFTFTIPNIKAMEELDNVKQYDEMPEKFDFEGVTILLAEDDNINKLLLRRALESANAKVLLASNGAEAVEILKGNNSIRIVLMDIKMPVMDGLEATQLIKSTNPRIPIVAQTAYALPDERKRAIEAGCDAYLTKPINITVLYKTINQLL